ncbi:MAG TPA: response regulator [Burkholderiales bacterium]|jgi:DNA-binding response OmpR family regulator|nr:response regulator [Burkholderiales bacterium]
MRLLLVEDDAMIGTGIQVGLRHEGYVVDWVHDAEAAEAALAVEDAGFALVLLDLGLPRKDGFTLLESLRRRRNRVPVLVITARDAVADRIKGLDLGADDYLVKPFDLDELAARIRAVLRRHAGRGEPLVEYGAFRLDPSARKVSYGGRDISVSAREFSLLQALLDRPGQALSRSQLEERLYGWGEEIASNCIEVHVHNLRRKLGERAIRTVRGVGYVIDGSSEPYRSVASSS